MTVSAALVLFAVIWFIALLVALPIQVTTQGESGAMIYEWSISDDGSTLHAYERYENSAAVLAHLAAFGEKFAQRLLQAADPTRFVVHGAPSDDAKEALSAFGPSYMAPLVGFAR